jgi:serine/threonine protein kinase
MGQVFLGRSTAGRLVAVKTIKVELAEEAGFRARFAQEVAAARRVSGVFTAPVVAADPEADMPWLATAYIPAPSLSELVRVCGPQPVKTIWWLAAGCAEALESIHASGLVHRDLKPSNVLVAPDGPRVIDFGVARAAERIQLTITRGSVGTPAYMAPEQARDTRQASLASDVFSLGATLLFAATGHAPYEGETVMDVLVRLATEPPDLAGLPSELDELITACLDRSPRRRPTSGALLKQIGPYIEVSHGAYSEAEHPFLAGTVMTLISEYQQGPSVEDSPSLAGDPSSEIPTFGSHTALPAPGRARWHRRTKRGQALRFRMRYGRALLALAGKAIGLIALVAMGVALSRLLPGHNDGPPNIPPSTSPSTFASLPLDKPAIEILQQIGYPSTEFVVHGSGWKPGSWVSIKLVGHRSDPERPEVDISTTFNYVVNQDHAFFAGSIPPGLYEIIVTDSDGQHASTQFRVIALHHTSHADSGPPSDS